MIPSVSAQESKPEVKPFGFNSPNEPPLAPDAPPIMYWNIDDIRKAHTEMAEKPPAVKEAGSGSSQSFGAAGTRADARFSMFMLYRMFRDKPVPSLTKVNSVLDDAEQHAGAYDFYNFHRRHGRNDPRRKDRQRAEFER